MSLISCVDPCIYQEEGYCTLERAVSTGQISHQKPCIHFIPKHSFTKNKRPMPLSNFEPGSKTAPLAFLPNRPVQEADRPKNPDA